jgi:hypothetical protein
MTHHHKTENIKEYIKKLIFFILIIQYSSKRNTISMAESCVWEKLTIFFDGKIYSNSPHLVLPSSAYHHNGPMGSRGETFLRGE